MKRFLVLPVLLVLSAPVTAHHTKEHVLQPPVVTSLPTAAETDSRLWYALGPFFLLVAFGFVRWGLKYRAERRSRRD